MKNYYHYNKKRKKFRPPIARKRILTINLIPMILFFTFSLMIILIIPTTIVLPFINKAPEQSLEPMQLSSFPNNEEKASTITVSVKRTSTDKIEDLPLETYVAGVVASEMPVEYEEEALKAQAVAARTYVVNYLLHLKKDNVITDTVQHQVYKNDEELRQLWGKDYEKRMEKLTKVVDETAGEIILHQNEPITPAFFSTSNGYTENAEDYWGHPLAYLKSVASPWDQNSSGFFDQKTFSVAELAKLLNITLEENKQYPVEISRTKSERVKELILAGHTFTGREVREKLDLRSSDFSIKQQEGHFVFTTKGYGHGIGMSQFGANELAKQGKTYEDIIYYYYQDVLIKHMDSLSPTVVNASK